MVRKRTVDITENGRRSEKGEKHKIANVEVEKWLRERRREERREGEGRGDERRGEEGRGGKKRER